MPPVTFCQIGSPIASPAEMRGALLELRHVVAHMDAEALSAVPGFAEAWIRANAALGIGAYPEAWRALTCPGPVSVPAPMFPAHA